ncbi:hypothetical protein BDV12DRAFT_208745 [Aspergillus spectabilis]
MLVLLNSPISSWKRRLEKATERWNTHQASTFAAVLSVGTEEELAIANARRLALDLSLLNTMHIDASAEMLTAGPGVTAGDVFDPAPGSCASVSLIGTSLGAGIGRLSGQHGLMIVTLLSARVVTATGEVHEVSSTSNPDLFWAIRGAGQNFGIVTSATYKQFPASHTYTSIDLIFPPEVNFSFFIWLANFDVPARWAVGVIIDYSNETGKVPLHPNKRRLPRPRIRSPHPPRTNPRPRPHPLRIPRDPRNKLVATTVFGMDAMLLSPAKSAMSTDSICGDGMLQLGFLFLIACVGLMKRILVGLNLVSEAWSNCAVVEVMDGESAYPWRDAEAYGDLGVRRVAVYVNYAKGDETLDQIYGVEKLPRLARLKGGYDPGNVFQFHHAIPSLYP